MKMPHPYGWGIFSLFAAPEERRPTGRPEGGQWEKLHPRPDGRGFLVSQNEEKFNKNLMLHEYNEYPWDLTILKFSRI